MNSAIVIGAERTKLGRSGERKSLLDAQASAGALALPTVGGRCAYVDHLWNKPSDNPLSVPAGVQPRVGEKAFEIEVTGDSSFGVTLLKLYALRLRPIVIADVDITSIAGNVFTKNNHGFKTGDGPIFSSGTGDFDTIGAERYAIFLSANTFSIATSRKNAMEGTALTLTGTTENAVFQDSAETCRVYQHYILNCGPAYDGSVTITAQEGWCDMLTHSQRNIGYQVSASYTGNLNIDLYPMQELV